MPYRTIEDSAKRIAVRLVKRGRDTRHEIADICDMSTRTIDRAVAQDRDEGFVGKHPGRKRGPKDILIAKDVELALRFVDHNPTRFLSELKDILERYRYISASEATIHRMLKKRRISLKKVQKMASEQTAEAEADFVVRIAEYPAHYLVCVDEMSKDDRTYARTRGRSRRGQRCKVYQPFVRKRRFTVIGGMALDAGIIASRVIEGSSDRDTFLDFLEEDLVRSHSHPLFHSLTDTIVAHHESISRATVCRPARQREDSPFRGGL
ncbi:hypothetical protein C8F01DRAFT_1003263 [Mycena amicta]|nr:hypothetical protein C8F01DRAFT_1003263 [Mycena amicta]